mgnify:FL=1|jgi:16S rRNA (guanine966-N2)-methyltransferase
MSASRGQLRIIAGRWRSRKLEFPEHDTLRPTPDRVRETLFNWLQADIPGSRCLDLFAGSGALGFEAASRGAGDVVMIERDRKVCAALEANRQLLGADNIQIKNSDGLDWLQHNKQPFDVVFLDPPYRSGMISASCSLLDSGQGLEEHAKIYVEHALDEASQIVIPENWECLREKSAGQVVYKLFSRHTE